MQGLTIHSIRCHVYLAVLVLLQILMTAIGAVSSPPLPAWKTQLQHFRKWSGTYQYRNQLYSCSLVVHHVALDYKGADVTFKTNQTAIDMYGISDDDVIVVFKKEYQDSAHPHFAISDNVEFEVMLVVTGRLYAFIGNITQPINSGYGTVRLYPDGSVSTSSTSTVVSSHLSVGLAVGVSLFMLVVCIVAGVIILRWAIRKGYLRHVAMSYKNFRNPSDAAVSFENDGQRSGEEQTEGNVHI